MRTTRLYSREIKRRFNNLILLEFFHQMVAVPELSSLTEKEKKNEG